MTLVVLGVPPIFPEIVAAFPGAAGYGVLFAWGDTIYNPSGVRIPEELFAHEGVHAQRQNGDPEKWWRRYMTDPAFRLAEEIPAHIEELRFAAMRPGSNRKYRKAYLDHVARRLSGPLYGKMITRDKAEALLRRSLKED